MKTLQITILFLAVILLFSSAQAQTKENLSGTTIRAAVLNNKAVIKADEEKYDEAIKLFREAIELRPDDAIAYANLGGTLYLAGQFEEAVTALKKAIELQPDYAEAFQRLGVVYCELGKTDKAVEFLKQAIKLKPNSGMAHYNLGCVYIRLQKFKEAVDALEHAAQFNPNYVETYIQKGFALSRLKKYGVAIKQFEKAVALTPQDSQAQLFLGQLYLANRDKQSALVQYRKLTLIDSSAANKLYTIIYGNLLVKVTEH